jgi:hypothetical protein
MDTLTFISKVIEALAWPVTLLIILLALRRPLLNLFPVIQRLRWQGLELDFGRQVQALAMEARQELPPTRSVLKAEEPLRTHWIELAQFSPRAVVLEAWVQLEKAAIEATRRHGLNLRSVDLKSPLILGQALEESGILQQQTPTIYHQLRNLRNAAAHASDFSFSPDSAIEYADLATRLTEYLQKT